MTLAEAITLKAGDIVVYKETYRDITWKTEYYTFIFFDFEELLNPFEGGTLYTKEGALLPAKNCSIMHKEDRQIMNR